MSDADLGLQPVQQPHPDADLGIVPDQDLGLKPAAPSSPEPRKLFIENPLAQATLWGLKGLYSGAQAVAPYADRLRGQVAVDIAKHGPTMPGPPAMTQDEINNFESEPLIGKHSPQNMAPGYETMLARKGWPSWAANAVGIPANVLLDPAFALGEGRALLKGRSTLPTGPVSFLNSTADAATRHALGPRILEAARTDGWTTQQTVDAYRKLGVWGRQSTWADTAERNGKGLMNEYNAIRDSDPSSRIPVAPATQGAKDVMKQAVGDRLPISPGADKQFEQSLADSFEAQPTATPAQIDKWISYISKPGQEFPNATGDANEALKRGLKDARWWGMAMGPEGEAGAKRAWDINQTRGPYLSSQETLEAASGKPSSIPNPGLKTLAQIEGAAKAPRNFGVSKTEAALNWLIGQPGVSSTYGHWTSKLMNPLSGGASHLNDDLRNIMDGIARQIPADQVRKENGK